MNEQMAQEIPYHPPVFEHTPHEDNKYIWYKYQLAIEKRERDMQEVQILIVDDHLAQLKCQGLAAMDRERVERAEQPGLSFEDEMQHNRARALHNQAIDDLIRKRGELVLAKQEAECTIANLEAELPALEQSRNLRIDCAYSGVSLRIIREDGRLVHIVE
ncbi:hypothetical protein V5O48_010095 [Marasmius crinis-equi]|uniref:Uncharacterized protein n=1 Tax=Marasmius crinis-equi TaxID=585013 RepID=A0ABR3F9B9_9AGAR